jgi:hypothetical protein
MALGMKSSRGISAFFALALGLSLSIKLIASRAEPQPDQRLFATTIASFLERQGFRAQPERRPLGMVVHGWKGNCRLMVREYEPHGTYADIYEKRARPIGLLSYVYRGGVSRSTPTLLPLTEYYVGRELRRVRIGVPRAPVLAVAASRGCDLARLPWREVATFPR